MRAVLRVACIVGVIVISAVWTAPVVGHSSGECVAKWKALNKADTEYAQAVRRRDATDVAFFQGQRLKALASWMRCVQGDAWPKCMYRGHELDLGTYTGDCRIGGS